MSDGEQDLSPVPSAPRPGAALTNAFIEENVEIAKDASPGRAAQ